jgi:hypothetical protein
MQPSPIGAKDEIVEVEREGFICPECAQEFQTSDELLSHFEDHQSNASRTLMSENVLTGIVYYILHV